MNLPTLHIHLLGECRVFTDNQSVVLIDRPRQQALLAYLLLHRHAPQLRQQLAFTFWPESTERQAYTNLRKLFFQLRRELPQADHFLSATPQYIGWRNDAPFTLDVAELEQALDQLESSNTVDVAAVEQVIALYRGELMPTCYDEWLLPIRRELQERVINTLTDASERLEAQGSYKAALRAAEHLLRLDPLHEASYRHLMRLRTLAGDRVGALRAYHECASVLQQELDVAPSQETQQIYEEILHGSGAHSPTPQSAASWVRDAEDASSALSGAVLLSPTAIVTELVGREREAEALRMLWRQVLAGTAQMVLIAGEAGIGKSRLAEELRRRVSYHEAITASARAYATQGALAYAPIADLLRSSDDVRAHLRKLDRVWLSEIARVLPEMLATVPDLTPPQPMTERWHRLHFFEALARAIFASEQPVLLICDDLQWYDEDTLEWLQYLLHYAPDARLLVVGTLRREEIDDDHPVLKLQTESQRTARLHQIELAALNAEETAQLAAQLVSDDLTSAQTAWLYQKSEGNPLFVVEMVRAGLDEQAQDTVEQLPQIIQSVIEARLSQLSPLARQLAQVAATIGRAFTVEVLAAASETGEDALIQGLDELWQRRIVREQQATYDFSHDMLREVAYRQQSPVRRRHLHRRIGKALARIYASSRDSVVGELAFHAEQAGNLEEAMGYIQQAVRVAQSVGAYQEVVTRLRHALELVNHLPLPEEAKRRHELSLLFPLGATLIPLRGYGNPEVEAVYRRAHELCATLRDDPSLMPALAGLSLFYMLRGELRKGLETSRQLLSLAESIQDDGAILEAHAIVGPMLMYLGEFNAAVEHFERTLALYDPVKHGDHALIYGQDPAVASYVCLATTLWHLGYFDRSYKALQDGLALAKQLSHKYTLGFAYGFASHLSHMRRQPVETEQYGELGAQLSGSQGFQYMYVVSVMLRGWGIIQQRAATGDFRPGDLRPGTFAPGDKAEIEQILAEMHDAFANHKQIGTGLFRGYYGSAIAEAHIAAGDLDDAAAGLEAALKMADVNDDQFWLAEIHRLRGHVWWLQAEANGQVDRDTLSEVESAFLQALSIAQRQCSIALELRAATSLARLWMKQGQPEKGYALLKRVYDRFTEGFDMPDLQEAASLLAQLDAE